MKNKNIIAVVFISFGLFFTNVVFADTNINLQIKNNGHVIYEGDINVIPCDSDKNIDTEDIETPYCAIEQSGVSSVWDWTWAPGAFVTSLDGVAGITTKDENGNDVYHYWGWFLNGSEAQEGLNQYQLKSDDKILLDFINPIEEKKEPETHSISGSYSTHAVITPIVPKIFNIENALKFLETNKKGDGSFGDSLYTDWVAVAIGAGDDKDIKLQLINYLKENDIDSSVVTDNERRAMALMSLGINPYNDTKINYIKKITDSFDGTQFGDKTLINDDIFALVVLKNSGYSVNDELIIKDLNYIISKQDKDGSWGSVDMTAAGVQSLKGFENIAGVVDAILKGEKYIITNQKIDGGFDNLSSTSWVLQILFENKEILKGEAYLASKQEVDGGMEWIGTDLNTRIWATAYAIPAILHKPWSIILNNFSKQEITIDNLNRKDLLKQKIVYKKLIKQNVGVIESVEDKKKIENIINNNGEVKVNKSLNIWGVFKVPFSWLLGKLGF